MTQGPNQPYPEQPQPPYNPTQHRPYPMGHGAPQPGQHPAGAYPGQQPPFVQGPPLPPPSRPERKGPFGPSFWIVGSLLVVFILMNAFAGQGEGILVTLGVSAVLTGLYSVIFKRRSWAALGSRRLATVVSLAGVASLLIGSIAGVADTASDERKMQAAVPATSAQLEANAAAQLKTREDAVVKSEADSAAKLKAREDAVAAREAAAGGLAAKSAAKTFGQGVWTVGKDIEPGDYKTTKAVVDCTWKITRTGSNGGDYIDYDFSVTGGFPLVSLVEGHTFDSDGCGDWAKQ